MQSFNHINPNDLKKTATQISSFMQKNCQFDYEMTPPQKSKDKKQNKINHLIKDKNQKSTELRPTRVGRHFFQQKKDETEINGKRIPSWAISLDDVNKSSKEQKALNLHLAVFGKLNKKSTLPLSAIFGFDNEYEKRSESNEWNEEENE